jgi:hypothetical protein
MKAHEPAGSPPDAPPKFVGQTLRSLLLNPWELIKRWNTKTASLSALYRGVIFLIASAPLYSAADLRAAATEAAFGAAFAGFFGTVTQQLRFAQPRWQAQLVIVGVIPLAFQTGEILSHAAAGTQSFHAGMIASAVATALSAAFNLFIMRRGALLVGPEGRSFLHDLGSLPKLIVMFVVSGALWIWRLLGCVGRFRSRDTTVSS